MSEWIEFKVRDLTLEEKEIHPDWYYMMDCPAPKHGEEILVSNGISTWIDTWHSDNDGCYLDDGFDLEIYRAAWMPLPMWRKDEYTVSKSD